MQHSLTKIAVFLMPVMLGEQSYVYARPETPASKETSLACEINPTTVEKNGYQLEVYLTNTGNEAVHGWTVTLNFQEPAQLTGSWNANLSEVSMTTVTGSNVAWNGRLLPGQTTSFGLQGNYDGSFVLPECSAR